MAGLTSSGFVPETYENIKDRIEAKLEQFSPGFDLSPDSPDGQLIGIMTYEIFQAWLQLGNVYNSYNPQLAYGAGLRNIGLLSGLPITAATRSYVTLETTGVADTLIPKGSIITNVDGEEFITSYNSLVPNNLQAIAKNPGVVDVSVGSVTTITTPIVGWDAVTQSTVGTEGDVVQTEQQYRNFRTRSVMRNYTSSADTMQARLLELGLQQAFISNNTSDIVTLPDGTPPNSIQVIVGEIGDVSREDIAKVIFDTNALGCPTYSSTGDSEQVEDMQGNLHTISFSIADAISLQVNLDVTYLSSNTAGALENIKEALSTHINGLLSGEDVIWSRLFGYITPYAKAQINSLTVGLVGGPYTSTNYSVGPNEYASIADVNIVVTET